MSPWRASTSPLMNTRVDSFVCCIPTSNSANVELKEQTEKFAASEANVDALTLERDAMKEALAKWTNAVAERDKQLKEGNAQIQKLADDLNAAVKKYNQLATNYNAVVEELNKLRSAAAKETKQP